MNAGVVAPLRPPVAHLVEQITGAHASGTPLRIVGSGTWLDGGRPVHADAHIHTTDLADVVEYVPSDLVITVGAGMTLASLTAITAAHGQWFACDPIGSDNSTIGATVATATAGPLALGSGTIRDLVLGLSAVTGEGTPIHVGGRVVKNVAGFDLTRLATGAFGTLGAITDVSLRLHAKPAADATFIVENERHDTLLALVAALGLQALSFHAMELISPAFSQSIHATASHQWTLAVRATGNSAAVQAQRDLLASLGTVRDAAPSLWHDVRHADGTDFSFRVSAAPDRIVATTSNVVSACVAGGVEGARLRVTPHRGTVRVLIASDAPTNDIATIVRTLNVAPQRVIGERLPDAAWAVLPCATSNPISRRLRDAFDPHRILNRGIFGEAA